MTVWPICPSCNKDTSEDLKTPERKCSKCGAGLITGSLDGIPQN